LSIEMAPMDPPKWYQHPTRPNKKKKINYRFKEYNLKALGERETCFEIGRRH
jgi:hypothetical protein